MLDVKSKTNSDKKPKKERVKVVTKKVIEYVPKEVIRYKTKKIYEKCELYGYKYANSVLVPLTDIRTRTDKFQNRTTAFSTKSTNAIVDAANSGNFRWEMFDAIMLWYDSKGELGIVNQLYVLSGHSRYEAFKKLATNNKQFSKIPAKIIREATLDEAIDIALNSNTLSTPESEVERAAYFQRLRQNGLSEKELREKIKRTEGNNATNIFYFTYLNPVGRTVELLSQLQGKDATSLNNARTIANWIGFARYTYPQLTNEHENELFTYLVTDAAFKRFDKRTDFSDMLQVLINRKTVMGKFENTPLNLMSSGGKSEMELSYSEQLKEQQAKIKSMMKERDAKLKQLVGRGITKTEANNLIKPFDDAIRVQRINLNKLLAQETTVKEAAANQTNLFDALKGIIYTNALIV